MIVNIKLTMKPFISKDKIKFKGEVLSQANGNIKEKEIWIVAFDANKEMLEKSIQLNKNDFAKFAGEYREHQDNYFDFKINSILSFQRKSKQEQIFFEDDLDQEDFPPPKRKHSQKHLRGDHYNFDELNVTREDIIRMRKDDPLSMYNLGYEPLDDCLPPLKK